MIRLWRITSKAYLNLLTVLSSISFLLIFFMAIWMCVDVVGRTVFNHPIPGTPELVKSLLPAIVFLSLAYTQRDNRHVYVEIIVRRFTGVAQIIAGIVANLFGFFMFALVTWFSWEPAWSGWLIREYEGVQLEIPVYPIRFVVFLGAGLFALQYLIELITNISLLFARRSETQNG